MTQQQKDELNKELCGLLGICWHEPDLAYYIKTSMPRCKKCKQPIPMIDQDQNPDFTSDAGKIRLLRELKNTKDWYFYAVKLINEVYLLDETGSFAIAARDFLKAMEAKE